METLIGDKAISMKLLSSLKDLLGLATVTTVSLLATACVTVDEADDDDDDDDDRRHRTTTTTQETRVLRSY